MHEAHGVGRGQRGGQRCRDGHDLARLQVAAAGEQGRERAARCVVKHKDVPDDLAQPYDVGRVQAGQRSGLAAQGLHR